MRRTEAVKHAEPERHVLNVEIRTICETHAEVGLKRLFGGVGRDTIGGRVACGDVFMYSKVIGSVFRFWFFEAEEVNLPKTVAGDDQFAIMGKSAANCRGIADERGK